MNRKQVSFAVAVVLLIGGLFVYVKVIDKSSSHLKERPTNPSVNTVGQINMESSGTRLAVTSLELVHDGSTGGKALFRVTLNSPTRVDTVVYLKSLNESVLKLPAKCVVKGKTRQISFPVTVLSVDSVAGATVKSEVDKNPAIMTVTVSDGKPSKLRPQESLDRPKEIWSWPVVVSAIASFSSLLLASVSFVMTVKRNRKYRLKPPVIDDPLQTDSHETRCHAVEKESNQQLIAILNDKIHSARVEFNQTNAVNTAKINEVISLYSSRLEALSYQVNQLQQAAANIQLSAQLVHSPCEVSQVNPTGVSSTEVNASEQDILAKLDEELRRTFVYPGSIKILSYYWDHFSNYLQRAFLLKLQDIPFQVIEPKCGDTFDPTTMEYVSLPVNCRKIVTEVVELGFVDLRTSEIYPAKVVII